MAEPGQPLIDRVIAVGFRRWKAHNLRPHLATLARAVHFADDAAAARLLAPGPGDCIVVWGAQAPGAVAELVRATGCDLRHVEDGFIRSVGLGSDLIPPHALVLDRAGIYFDATRPSDLEILLQQGAFDAAKLARAQAVRRFILDNQLTKYNLEDSAKPTWDNRGRVIALVPGQVESDASIALGGTEITSNLALLRAVRMARPDAWIVYKPHPDVLSMNRKGRLARREAAAYADHIETGTSIVGCIDAADEIHTITSLSGFDALLRGKPVITWGMPFYAGWGLTEDRCPQPAAQARRHRRLGIDELVAGALIDYPLYWSAGGQELVTCEIALSMVAKERDSLAGRKRLERLRKGFWRRQVRKLRTLSMVWLGTRQSD